MTDFKWRHFQGDVILWAVRWYCRYPISYRDLEEMRHFGRPYDDLSLGPVLRPGDGEAAALVLAAWL